jgi:hypothetical protein
MEFRRWLLRRSRDRDDPRPWARAWISDLDPPLAAIWMPPRDVARAIRAPMERSRESASEDDCPECCAGENARMKLHPRILVDRAIALPRGLIVRAARPALERTAYECEACSASLRRSAALALPKADDASPNPGCAPMRLAERSAATASARRIISVPIADVTIGKNKGPPTGDYGCPRSAYPCLLSAGILGHRVSPQRSPPVGRGAPPDPCTLQARRGMARPDSWSRRNRLNSRTCMRSRRLTCFRSPFLSRSTSSAHSGRLEHRIRRDLIDCSGGLEHHSPSSRHVPAAS